MAEPGQEIRKMSDEIRSNIEKIENVFSDLSQKYKEFIDDSETLRQTIESLREGWRHFVKCLSLDCEIYLYENKYGDFRVRFKEPSYYRLGYIEIKRSDIDKVFDIVRDTMMKHYISYLVYTSSVMESLMEKIESSLHNQMNKIKEMYSQVENEIKKIKQTEQIIEEEEEDY